MRLALYTMWLVHMAVIFGNLAAMIVVPFVQPWYIALPIITLLGNLMLTPINCPLTRWENKIRKRLGMRTIKGFTGHYLIKPLRRKLRRKGRVQ